MPVIHIPESIQCPLEIHRGLPFLKAKVNGLEGLFLLDSGTATLELSQDFLPQQATNSKAKKKRSICVDEFALEEYRITQVEVSLFNGADLENSFGVKCAGIIGFRELVHFNWVIDLPMRTISFLRKLPLESEEVTAKIRGRYRNHLPIFPVQIGSETYQLGITTGFPGLAFDKRLRKQLTPHLLESPRHQKSHTLKYLSFEGHTFLKTNMLFGDLSELDLPQGGYDGIIGTPLLEQGPVILDWNRRLLAFLNPGSND